MMHMIFNQSIDRSINQSINQSALPCEAVDYDVHLHSLSSQSGSNLSCGSNPKVNHSNESYRAELSYGAVYQAVQGDPNF